VSETLRVLHLVPRTLSQNGEIGNITVLRRRAELKGLAVEVLDHESGADLPDAIDLVFIGSGPVSAQIVAQPAVLAVAEQLRALAAAGVPFLAIAAGFQLLGESVTMDDGSVLEGARVFPVTTVVGGTRIVGDFVVESRLGTLVGFENRGSAIDIRTAAPIGTVTYGQGNTPDSGVEGYWVDSLIGTHLHGPVLANNPDLADWLLSTAFARRGVAYPTASTPELDEIDRYASEARRVIAASPLSE
jgi:CobQ-like glutamine amidotransferase family enzyme